MMRAFAAIALLGLHLPALAADPEAIRKLDAELSAIVADPARPLASLSVLAMRGGRVVYERQFGRRFIDGADPQRDRAADRRTLYRIASITKLVTALGVLRLLDKGVLSLDADIGTYLGYAVRNPHFPRTAITLRMLLAHTSSLRDDADYVFPPGHEMRDFLVPGGKAYGTGAMWSAKAPPGTYFAYCNLNSGVIATIMEKVTGERFDRLMRRLVLEPLGMRGGFNPAEMTPAQVSHIATLYRKAREVDGKEAWDPQGPWVAQVDDYSERPPVNRAGSAYRIGSNGALFGPQGNLRASVEDLARVMRMIAGRGVIDGKRFLDARTVEAMLARHWKSDGGSNGEIDYGSQSGLRQAWGLGNQQFVDAGRPGWGDRLVEGGGFSAIGHLGDAYGLHGAFLVDPATGNGIIYLAGGTGFDPESDPGEYSALHRYEERILTAVYRRALQDRAD